MFHEGKRCPIKPGMTSMEPRMMDRREMKNNRVFAWTRIKGLGE